MSLPGPEELRSEIIRVKELTDKPFGVNFAIGQHNRPYEDMVQVAIEEKVPVVSVTGGNPKGVLEMVKEHPIKTLVLVAAKRQAPESRAIGS